MAWRRMKPNHANYRPRRCLFFDTETKPSPDPSDASNVFQTLRLGVARVGRYDNGELKQATSHTFFHSHDFWRIVEKSLSKRDTIWVFAHNLIFDLRAVNFEEQFDEVSYVCDSPRGKRNFGDKHDGKQIGKPLVCLENPPCIIGMRHVASGARLVCVDSFNWFRDSIASLGKMIDLAKLPMPEMSDPDSDWLTYCKRDVEILERTICLLFAWCDKHDCGMFRYSAAGQAMAAFRHRFMNHEIVTHDEELPKSMERRSYFGGQSETYRVGKLAGELYHLDVTSLYPSVMLNNLFPVKLLNYEQRQIPQAMAPAIDYRYSVAEVCIRSDDARYPKRQDGRPIYPTGWYRTVLAGPELIDAVSRGVVTHWGYYAEYQCKPLFTEYVDYFWNLRQKYKRDGNAIMEQFTKLMLNSLFGKFGQRSSKWEIVPDRIAEIPWATWKACNNQSEIVQCFRSVGWQVEVECEPGEKQGTLPIVSSFVTSYGRLRMRKLRDIAGRNHVFYQATDSLIVDRVGFDRLSEAGEIADGTLGKLRIVKVAENVDIRGVGDYTLDDDRRTIGRRKDAVADGDGGWSQARFDGPGSLFQGLTRKPFGVRTIKVRKPNPYVSGTIGGNGDVTPFVVFDGDPSTANNSSCAEIIDSAASLTASEIDSAETTDGDSMARTTAAIASSIESL